MSIVSWPFWKLWYEILGPIKILWRVLFCFVYFSMRSTWLGSDQMLWPNFYSIDVMVVIVAKALAHIFWSTQYVCWSGANLFPGKSFTSYKFSKLLMCQFDQYHTCTVWEWTMDFICGFEELLSPVSSSSRWPHTLWDQRCQLWHSVYDTKVLASLILPFLWLGCHFILGPISKRKQR